MSLFPILFGHITVLASPTSENPCLSTCPPSALNLTLIAPCIACVMELHARTSAQDWLTPPPSSSSVHRLARDWAAHAIRQDRHRGAKPCPRPTASVSIGRLGPRSDRCVRGDVEPIRAARRAAAARARQERSCGGAGAGPDAVVRLLRPCPARPGRTRTQTGRVTQARACCAAAARRLAGLDLRMPSACRHCRRFHTPPSRSNSKFRAACVSRAP